MLAKSGSKRSFLFLQGLATPFFYRLGRETVRRGHSVHRINLCGGDRVFWPHPGAVNFRGRFADWRSFVGAFLHERGVTDVVLFGDCRPYHRVAIEVARSRGIAIHVFEEGYFRPDWITLERDGTNAFSSLPRDAASILSETEPESANLSYKEVSGGFSKRICWETLNQFSTILLSPLYPHYRRHRAHHPLSECGGWTWRMARRPFERGYAKRVSRFFSEENRKFYLLPLQLETDYQIRRHSSFKSMTDVIRLVLESFSRHAPADAAILIKLHPLDNGLVNYRRKAYQIARRLNLLDRVYIIDGGHLPTLLSSSAGVVVVNSTTGLSALHHNRPLKVLGRALFDIAGLTYQGSLDRFWNEGATPDQDLFRAYRRVVLQAAQVNGSFFTKAGMMLALDGVMERLSLTPVAAPAALPAESAKPELAAAKPAILARQ